ncbi:hypothetical protein [Pleomorphovibrio marinus]|uniref:hypothetical protein n=1 Tax=Pleomorphovibrio marinus TaxID=2164132 RepID=UPI000E0B0B0E|nr:hypothetical protein [Pleomorphovibrio marinus]
MIQKLFPLDKNYLLRQAQASVLDTGLRVMVDELRASYTRLYNPLGLKDDTYLCIISNEDFPHEYVSYIYEQLCGIYRYRYGSNQLEILFDGRSHSDKYQEDWIVQLQEWVRELGNHESYVKSLLRMTLLYDTESRAIFSENRCKSFLNEYFEVKIIKRKGDLVLKTA